MSVRLSVCHRAWDTSVCWRYPIWGRSSNSDVLSSVVLAQVLSKYVNWKLCAAIWVCTLGILPPEYQDRSTINLCRTWLDQFQELSVNLCCNVLPSNLAIAVLLGVTCAWEVKLFNRRLIHYTLLFFVLFLSLWYRIFTIMLYFINYLPLQSYSEELLKILMKPELNLLLSWNILEWMILSQL